MMLGSSNPVGTGGGINYVGNHAYAYSGIVTSSSSVANLLEFTTGSEYIYVKTCLFSLSSISTSGVNYDFEIKMNGETVSKQFLTDPFVGRDPADSDQLYLIIPPFTKFEAIASSSSGDHEYAVTLVGRVYA